MKILQLHKDKFYYPLIGIINSNRDFNYFRKINFFDKDNVSEETLTEPKFYLSLIKYKTKNIVLSINSKGEFEFQ